MALVLGSPLLASLPSGVSLRRLSVLIASGGTPVLGAVHSPAPAQGMRNTKATEPPSPSAPFESLPTGLSLKEFSFMVATAETASSLGLIMNAIAPVVKAHDDGALAHEDTISAPADLQAIDASDITYTLDTPAAALLATPLAPRTAIASASTSAQAQDDSLDSNSSAGSSFEEYLARVDDDDRLARVRRLTVQPSMARLVVADTVNFRLPSADIASTLSSPVLSAPTPSPALPAPAPRPSGSAISLRDVHSALTYLSASLTTLDTYHAELAAGVAAGAARRDVLRAELANARRAEARERQMARWARTLDSSASLSTLASRRPAPAFPSPLVSASPSTVTARTAPITSIAPGSNTAPSIAALSMSTAASASTLASVLVSALASAVAPTSIPSAPVLEPSTSIRAGRVFSREGLEPLEAGTIDAATGLWRMPSLTGTAARTLAIKEQVLRKLTVGRKTAGRAITKVAR
jgi:hypothetical protein